jgi:2,4-dienoyl-CoA reductase-like NADH-dependent reductase (Old Yellow Enzyme family)
MRSQHPQARISFSWLALLNSLLEIPFPSDKEYPQLYFFHCYYLKVFCNMSSLFESLSFTRGPDMKNRFMLAPLTNSQSHADGTLSDEEYKWLTMRAEGGFGLTMTCAAHVQAIGQGFAGQLGTFSDNHLLGLTRLAAGINGQGSVSICQLHHAGMRSPAELIGEAPICPSSNEETGARAMTTAEVEQLVQDFVAAAARAEKAGFHGVEIHGAHGYILCQFLSSEINQRDDQYGGSLENRSRIIFEIIEGIRKQCQADFMIGVRLSPERFGMKLSEILVIAQRLMGEGQIDFLDMSLWDVFKEPVEEEMQGRSLLSYFTDLERGGVRLGIAGKIRTPAEAKQALAADVDWVMLGRAAILHHDFPNQCRDNPDFTPVEIPTTREHLFDEGLSEKFVDYMCTWEGFVATD